MLLLTPNSNLTGLYLKLLYLKMANKGITYMVCVLAVQRPRTAQLIPKRTRSDPGSEYGWSFRKGKTVEIGSFLDF